MKHFKQLTGDTLNRNAATASDTSAQSNVDIELERYFSEMTDGRH